MSAPVVHGVALATPSTSVPRAVSPGATAPDAPVISARGSAPVAPPSPALAAASLTDSVGCANGELWRSGLRPFPVELRYHPAEREIGVRTAVASTAGPMGWAERSAQRQRSPERVMRLVAVASPLSDGLSPRTETGSAHSAIAEAVIAAFEQPSLADCVALMSLRLEASPSSGTLSNTSRSSADSRVIHRAGRLEADRGRRGGLQDVDPTSLARSAPAPASLEVSAPTHSNPASARGFRSGGGDNCCSTQPLHVNAGPARSRGACVVFLLPNATESDEFMQVVSEAFPEDRPTMGGSELARVRVCACDNADAAQVSVALRHLRPIDALEDVQRRTRTKAQPRRSPVPACGRKAALFPKFPTVANLPKVDDDEAASSTVVAYIVRPFQSAKDAERQLGPILLVEASYNGPSNARGHIPQRMVVALEEPGDMPALDDLGAGIDFLHRGPLGTRVLDRLKQRGVQLPVVSVERRNIAWHRWLMRRVGALLIGTLGLLGPATDAVTNAATATGAASKRSTPRSEPSSPTPTPADPPMLPPPPAAKMQPLETPLETPLVEPFAVPPMALQPRPLQPLPLPATLLGRPRPAAPGGASATAGKGVELDDPVGCVGATEETLTNGARRTMPSLPADELQMAIEVAATLPVEDQLWSKWRWADAVAFCDVDGGCGSSPPNSVDGYAGGQKVTAPPSQFLASAIKTLQGWPHRDDKPLENTPTPADEEVKNAETDLAQTPVIQVGSLQFSQAGPEIATQRLGQILRPGTSLVMITTEHYGSPLLCLDGDIEAGIMQLAPIFKKDGCDPVLEPQYWQYDGGHDADATSSRRGGGEPAPGGVGSAAAWRLSKHFAKRRSRQSTALPMSMVLPTLGEEDEVEEDDDKGKCENNTVRG